MAFKLADFIKETSIVTGTSADIDLNGAVTQYAAFSSFLANGDTTWAFVRNADGSEWECRESAYISATNKLARSGRLIASSTGSAVNFTAGTKTVVCGLPASIAQKIGVMRGHLFGLTLSNNATDPTNDIDIATGEAASDDSSPALMALTSALTKQLDATWAAGTNAGGRESGDTLGNKTYHVWLIQRSDTGAVDVLFSASATSPTMPTNYDRKRRIGSILRSGGSIVQFLQNGDLFLFATPMQDLSGSTTQGTSNTNTLSVPTGIRVLADVTLTAQNTTGIIAISLLPPDFSYAFGSAIDLQTPASATYGSMSRQVLTNTSAQIKSSISAGSGNIVYLQTRGWVDARGRVQ